MLLPFVPLNSIVDDGDFIWVNDIGSEDFFFNEIGVGEEDFEIGVFKALFFDVEQGAM